MDCNICRCGYNNTLMCTKMGCLSYTPKRTRRQERIMNIRKYNKDPRKTIHPWVQPIKVHQKGRCKPGKIFKKACKMCFCTDKKETLCSDKRVSCNTGHISVKKPDDVRPSFTDREFIQLPKLAHSAAKCDPGKAYKVDCNPCLCREDGNLLCEKLLCISQEDTQRIAARRITGRSCNDTEYTKNNCIKCSCNGTLQCEPIDDCVSQKEREIQKHGKSRGSRIALNYKKDECLPNYVYREDCNKCYCQKDKSLRCTQKTCLNYVQVIKLEKQRLYLQKHGL